MAIPPEALGSERAILISGSRTSGGFSLSVAGAIRSSPLGAVLRHHPDLGSLALREGEPLEFRGGVYCWVQLHSRTLSVPLATLARRGVRPGDQLLAIRGGRLGVSFAVRGPIVAEAGRHLELPTVLYARSIDRAATCI